MKFVSKALILLSIAIISFFMHIEHFPKDLMSDHVWRQTQTQSTINNFFEEDMNIFNPRQNERGNTNGISRMEFPLMQWLGACLYKIFGKHLIITRAYMFVVGLLSILGLYTLLSAIFRNNILALMGAWAFSFSPSFYYFTINPLPDNLALCCSIWGSALFFIWLNKKRIIYLMSCGFMMSIGALCKLPFIIYYVVPFTYFLIMPVKINKKSLIEITSAFSFMVFPVLWYAIVIPHWNGNIIIKGMLANHESLSIILFNLEHNLFVILPELLLNYGSVVFFLTAFFFIVKKKAYKDFRFPIFIVWSVAVLAYYLFEANAIGTGHDYYLFPFYPLLFILVAYGAYNLFSPGKPFFKYLTIALLLILPFTCYMRMQVRWNPEKPYFNKDLLVYKDELVKAVPNNSLVVAGNDISHFIFFYYINKKGWGYDNDYLVPDSLKAMIEKGAEYIYSDSRRLDNNPEISQYFGGLVCEKGSIKVFKLKKKSPASMVSNTQ